MKKFGLIGGTSWHSTVTYYTAINQRINDHYGDNTNPPLHIVNLNQKQLHDLQRTNEWDAISAIYIETALELQKIGVEGIALCANTPHKIFTQLDNAVACPILHIADSIGSNLVKNGLRQVGLLGTRFTMSQGFIKDRLLEQYQIKTFVPPSAAQDEMQTRIYDELVVGTFNDVTKAFCIDIIEALAAQGAEVVILGCTELPLLLQDVDCPVPIIDSMSCHCKAIVGYILP